MRSRTPPISSEIRGGLNTPNPPRYATGYRNGSTTFTFSVHLDTTEAGDSIPTQYRIRDTVVILLSASVTVEFCILTSGQNTD